MKRQYYKQGAKFMLDTPLEEIIIHDINNPLSGITTVIGLFNNGNLGNLTEEQLKFIDLLSFSTKIITKILTNLQHINNLEANNLTLKKRTFAADELKEKLAWLAVYAQHQENRLVVNNSNGLTITADKKLLIEVLEDLVLNTLKQSERGEKINLDIKKAAGQLVIELDFPVAGLPKDYWQDIFDKDFKPTHPELQTKIGPGLSFYFCRLAIEAHGGTIRISGEPKTKIILTLPNIIAQNKAQPN